MLKMLIVPGMIEQVFLGFDFIHTCGVVHDESRKERYISDCPGSIHRYSEESVESIAVEDRNTPLGLEKINLEKFISTLVREILEIVPATDRIKHVTNVQGHPAIKQRRKKQNVARRYHQKIKMRLVWSGGNGP